VLRRFALAAALDQLAKLVQFLRREGAFEVQIELHARHLEQMRQKQFHLEARRVHAFFGQKIRALLDDFKHRHPPNLKAKRAVQSLKVSGPSGKKVLPRPCAGA